MKSNGFTLLMAMIISSLLLSLGIAVYNILIKELVLSSYGRNSQFAFYAADTGMECALFWDVKMGSFATSSPSNIECDGKTTENIGSGLVSKFNLSFSPDQSCAVITIDKTGPGTIIESRGYNSCNTTNARRVERGLRIRY